MRISELSTITLDGNIFTGSIAGIGGVMIIENSRIFLSGQNDFFLTILHGTIKEVPSMLSILLQASEVSRILCLIQLQMVEQWSLVIHPNYYSIMIFN